MFTNRKILIATKHHKEKVIAPLLEQHFGMDCSIAHHFDTDSLGTFTGEIERKEDPLLTLRNKCLHALEGTNFDLAIASEGSFGPHPTNYFITAGDELILLLDRKNNIELLARELTTETNFNARTIQSYQELLEFSSIIGFPQHRLIMRKSMDDFEDIYKGIGDAKELKNRFDALLKKYGKAYIETDMRAMYNPTRMKSIERGLHHLIESMKSLCPSCKTPGFTVRKSESGLPCAWCNTPTKSPKNDIKTCIKCDFEERIPYPNNRREEDPTYCDICNP